MRTQHMAPRRYNATQHMQVRGGAVFSVRGALKAATADPCQTKPAEGSQIGVATKPAQGSRFRRLRAALTQDEAMTKNAAASAQS